MDATKLSFLKGFDELFGLVNDSLAEISRLDWCGKVWTMKYELQTGYVVITNYFPAHYAFEIGMDQANYGSFGQRQFRR